ncbi:MAG: hypothetical protein BGO63_03640 [Candidatus Accumulibacter sp. 66-26]|nr:MAG: hypothetical protein BGO63_03640 [Candidatus Accumulibacter sp. 66-26]
MQELMKRELYGEAMALNIERLGSTAVTVANRWVLGWPEQVEALVENASYLKALSKQVEIEKDILSEATEFPHLAAHEILALHEIPMGPPTQTAST